MDAVALITLWQLASVILPIVGAIALAAFLIFCIVGFVLWASGRGLGEAVPPDSNAEWFDSL